MSVPPLVVIPKASTAAASPFATTTQPALKVPRTAPATPLQLQVPAVYPATALSTKVGVPALTESVLLVYLSVLAPSATPGPKLSPPALVVIPKASTAAVPPLSLTIRFTSVRVPALTESVLLVYFSVLAPSATPPSKVSAPALVVIPKAPTAAVPPLSLTIRFTSVSEPA